MHKPLTEDDLDEAATWVVTRLYRKERDWFRSDGQHFELLAHLVTAITFALRYLFIQEFDVPYIWAHKRDYITHFDESDIRTRVDLLSLDDLWRVYAFGQKCRSLLEHKRSLESLYARLGVADEYFENEVRRSIDNVEIINDTTEWLRIKYKDHKKDSAFELHFHDDEEHVDTKKRKMPSRISMYEVAKKSVVYKLSQVGRH